MFKWLVDFTSSGWIEDDSTEEIKDSVVTLNQFSQFQISPLCFPWLPWLNRLNHSKNIIYGMFAMFQICVKLYVLVTKHRIMV